MTNSVSGIFLLMVTLFSFSSGKAQEKSHFVPLRTLLKQAVSNYPLLKSRYYEIQAAEQGVDASKRALVPTLDASYQANFATYNNIIGMANSGSMVPISGPPSTENNYKGVVGSSVGLLLNWQPITFGQRSAQVDYSKAGLIFTTANTQNEVFQHEVRVINAYLDALVAKEMVVVYEKNKIRTESNYAAIKSLVMSGIKPGLDSSMFKAELSRSKIELLNSRSYWQQSVITLSQYLASDSAIDVADSSYFSRLPQISMPATLDSARHPLLSLYSSNISLSKAKGKMLSQTLLPTLGLWGTTFARGSGVRFDGTANASDGLNFQRYNYGIGLQLSVPLLQYARISPQIQQQQLLVKSNEEKLKEVSLQLRKQLEMADATLYNAWSAARENPVLLESSDFSYRAMLSRYQSGLANFSDLVQAQYSLVRAEAEMKAAYVNVWKALLKKAAVEGNLNLFLNQVN